MDNNKGGLSMCIARVLSISVLLFMAAVVCGWASDDDQNQKTISGTVVSIDRVGSIITVHYSDPVSGNTDEINIIVPDEAEIMNGPKTKSFCDILQLDPVAVTYYDDGISGLKAKKIVDFNQPNR